MPPVMLDTVHALIFPALGPLYQALAPWAEAALRVVVGLALVPHGLRNTFGFFPTTGVPVRTISPRSRRSSTATAIGRASFWAPAISITQLVGGPAARARPVHAPGGGADPDFPPGRRMSSAGGSAATSGTSSASNTP